MSLYDLRLKAPSYRLPAHRRHHSAVVYVLDQHYFAASSFESLFGNSSVFCRYSILFRSLTNFIFSLFCLADALARSGVFRLKNGTTQAQVDSLLSLFCFCFVDV